MKRKTAIYIKKYIRFYFIINLIISIKLRNDIILLYSSIILRFNRTGNNKIFNRADESPDEIYINGKNQNVISNTYYFNESETNNKVELIWKTSITSTSEMFRDCLNITEIDLSNFDSSQIQYITNMFNGCSSLTSINLSSFDTSKTTNFEYLFCGCSSLISLNLSSFDTSKVKSMGHMFQGCSSLISLDLSNFDTSQVRLMYDMFECCVSIISLDLSNFNTSKVERMDGMFKSCSSLTSLIISNFITSQATSTTSIFYNCTSLTSLDLSSFEIPKLTDMRNMFRYCERLYYLNLKKAIINSNAYDVDNFYANSKNLILCCSDEKWKEFLEENDKYSIYIYCIDNLNYEFKCYKHSENKNIYNNTCELCGTNYYQNNSNDSFIHCYQQKNNEQDSNDNNNIITTNIINNNLSAIINDKKNELIKNYKIMNSSELEILIEGKNDILLALTTTNNQKNDEIKNKSTINLGECEYKLKDKYNISYNDSLYIIKLDVKLQEMKIPKIEYEVYYPLNNEELNILNLSICKDSKIDVSIPIIVEDNLEKNNPKSEYYNNICSKTTSGSGTDISLTDRKNNFIDNNMALCEEDCDFIDYNNSTKKAKCSCYVKIKLPLIEEIRFDKNKLYKSFTDIKNIINIKIMKCFKNVLKIESLIKNYGFFIFIFILILYFICFFLFYFKYYFDVIKKINDIINAKKKKHKHSYNTRKYKRKEKNKLNMIIDTNNKDENNFKNNFPPKKKKNKTNIIKLKSNNNFDDETLSKIKMINNENNNNLKPKENTKFPGSKEMLKYNDIELNSLSYNRALIYDKRTFIQYYISLLKGGNLLIFSFYSGIQDYNSQIIKIFLFFFFLSVDITVNALFFNDNTLHKIYVDEGKFNFIYQMPQVIYSSFISGVINSLIKYLSLSQNDIIKIKLQKFKGLKIKAENTLNILKIKFVLFFIFAFLFLLGFLYYITCFCGIYVNTQIHLIKDSVISFCLSLLYPFCIYLIPGIFRLLALRAKEKNKQCLYSFSKIIQ